MNISQPELEELQKLEESLWRPETRFNKEYMDGVLAPDFFEFGRSGRIYTREEILAMSGESITVKLPFKDFKIRYISDNVVQVTYVSEVQHEELEIGNRSSIWIKNPEGWKLKFHQGTVVS